MFWIFWKHYIKGTNQVHKAAGNTLAGNVSSPSYSKNDNVIFDKVLTFGNDVLCIMDTLLECSYISDNWRKVTGLSTSDTVGSGLRDRISFVFQEFLKSYLENGSITDNSVRFQLLHHDNELHWCELKIIGIEESTQNEPRRCICLLHNVNALVTAQGNMEKARFEADIAHKSRAEFLANMSHELRTPLNAIIGFAQMMENGIYGEIGHPKYNDYIGNIEKSGLVLLSKINDLLDIANINSGQVILCEAEYDLVSIIRSALEFHSHTAFAAQVGLRECLPVKPLGVYVDRIRIMQVLGNILSNAIKHSPCGETVDIYHEKRKCGGISIVVEDKGNGISTNHLDNIRAAFGADNSFLSRSRECVGLGLAISQEIMKLHQGKIEIESEKGKGTVLRMMLPAERSVKSVEKKTKMLKQAFEEM